MDEDGNPIVEEVDEPTDAEADPKKPTNYITFDLEPPEPRRKKKNRIAQIGNDDDKDNKDNDANILIHAGMLGLDTGGNPDHTQSPLKSENANAEGK